MVDATDPDYHLPVAEAELAALVDALPERPFHAPEWVDEVLASRWAGYRTPAAAEPDAPVPARAWSVGCVLGIETLVQSRPVVRDPQESFLEDFMRPAAPCTIATFSATREASRPGDAAISRYERWIGGCSQDSLLETEAARAAGLRATLRASVPAFLQRSILQNHDDELLFFVFLARLHAAGGLGSAYAKPELIRGALTTLEADLAKTLGEDFRINMMVYDGRNFAMLHRGGTLTTWVAPARPEPRHRTGPRPMAGIPRGAVLYTLSPNGTRDPSADPIPNGVFSVDPGNPAALDRG
jgi:hypothetical protein